MSTRRLTILPASLALLSLALSACAPTSLSSASHPAPDAPAGPGKTYDIRRFGAVGDGKTKDTAAFQKALDACAKTGGVVLVPAGNYLIGSIVLGSNTTLRMEQGATLAGSPDKADYPLMNVRWEGRWRQGHRALIHANDAQHIAIVGPGAIVGDASVGFLRDPRGPALIEPVNCKDVRLENFSTRYVRMWSIHLTYCEDVVATGLNIRSDPRRSNGDGIDVDSCRNVTITHCDIDTGDDAIALKSGRGMEAFRIARPTENVTITDCKLGSDFAGLALGTEMSGGIRNVTFERCEFTRGANGIFIKSRIGRGGVMENITGKDLVGDPRVSCFLRFDLKARGIQDSEPVQGDAGIPEARNIRLTNVKVNVPTLLDATAIPDGKPVQGLSLENVTGVCQRGMNLFNIKDVEFKEIRVTGYRGALLTARQVLGNGLDALQDAAGTQPASTQ